VTTTWQIAVIAALTLALTAAGLALLAGNRTDHLRDDIHDPDRGAHARIDALQDRQDIVDRRWRDAEMAALAQIGNPAHPRKGATKAPQSPHSGLEPPPANPDTPGNGTEAHGGSPAWLGTTLETAIRDVARGRIATHSAVTPELIAQWRAHYGEPEPAPETIDADVRDARPPVPPPPAAPTEAIRQVHRTEPITDPTPPRRARGRWVEDPHGNLTYQREDDA
jgi:hypothetical protein